MPHAALWVVQLQFPGKEFVILKGFNAARGFVGGAAVLVDEGPYRLTLFQCRTRLCGWCSFYDGQWSDLYCAVSMPHAALWVVQLRRSQPLSP